MKDGIEQKKTEGRETRVKEAALTAMIKDVKDQTGCKDKCVTLWLHMCKYSVGQISVLGISKGYV